MRSCLLLGLAACWASPATSTTSPPVAKKPPVRAAADVTAAPRPEPKPYVLPAQVANALASESLAGNVLVVTEVHPTSAGARAGTRSTLGNPVAMQVVKDHGDVVEVSTARVADCEGSFAEPYELTAFVRRTSLVPRAKSDVTKAFADGTAVAIDRGAPVEITDAGLAWNTGAFTATQVLPREDQLTYAVPPSKTATAMLPQQTAERLVCDKTNVMTMAEWHAQQRAEQEEKDRERREARAAELERRRPEIERERKARAERAERERKECEKKARAKKAKQRKPGSILDGAGMSNCALASVFGDGGIADSIDVGVYERGGFGASIGAMSHPPPYCGVHDPAAYHYGSTTPPKAKRPTIDGNAIDWPSYYERVANHHVVRHSSHYLADLGYRCGRLRVAVEAAAVRSGGGGAAGFGGGQVPVWIPKPGPVTWLDGSPAGRYTGNKKYKTVVENGDRFCVAVKGVAEMVCHPKQTTTTGMSYRSGFD